MGSPTQVLTGVGTLVAGACVGVASVLVHGNWWGLLVALTATFATLVALPGGWWRLPFAAGWSAVVAVLAPERPEGDYLIAADTAGYLLLGAAVVVLLSGMVGARRHPEDEFPENSGVAGSAP